MLKIFLFRIKIGLSLTSKRQLYISMGFRMRKRKRTAVCAVQTQDLHFCNVKANSLTYCIKAEAVEYCWILKYIHYLETKRVNLYLKDLKNLIIPMSFKNKSLNLNFNAFLTNKTRISKYINLFILLHQWTIILSLLENHSW